MHTCIHAYMHTYIHTYKQTNIYIHTCVWVCVNTAITSVEELWDRDGWVLDLLLDMGKELRSVPMIGLLLKKKKSENNVQKIKYMDMGKELRPVPMKYNIGPVLKKKSKNTGNVKRQQNLNLPCRKKKEQT